MKAGETPHLTAEFCKQATDRLIFQPADVEEAAFIAAQLQGMGFHYYRAEFAGQLEMSIRGCLYLDNDKTIMVVDNKRDGIACSIDGFKEFFVPEKSLDGDARLQPEDCRHKTLVFYPRSPRDARSILSALLKNGATPLREEEGAASMMRQAVVYGILVREGRISFGPGAQDLMEAEICSAADLGVRPAVTLSAEQATIMAAFNEMGARMEQMSQRIARLEDAVLPKEITKKPLPAPKR